MKIMTSNNPIVSEKAPCTQSLRALDYLSMFIGDVIGGIGPYLAAYLRASRHWDQANIGAALSAMGIATILAQTPAGAVIDRLQQKRILLCFAAGMMSLSCIAITIFAQFHAILAAQIVYGVGAAIAGPCIVAISLGVVGQKIFALRIARNEAFNHIGNVIAALLAGLAGYLISPNWIFYLVAIFGLASIMATAFIKEQDIDHELARGAKFDGETGASVSLAVLLSDRRILAFALAVLLFHLANAAMLPLAGQYLAEGQPKTAPIWISACIIAAQLVMIPVSIMAGNFAQSWGRKPVFLIGFAVLPIRGLLYTLSNSPLLVVPVQLLDGIGAGIFGVLASVIVADLTKGTGHYNVTRGLIITAQGIGAALSNILAGWIVHAAGYSAGFMSLALIAGLGLVICYLGLPETRNAEPIMTNGSQEYGHDSCPS
jgi:MFS family permease